MWGGLGEVQEVLFSDGGGKDSLWSFQDGLGTIVFDYGYTLGVPWEVIVDEKLFF
jgi:hypothetical protein